MIKAGIIGATGYAGSELVRILSSHPDTVITYLGSHSYAGKKYSDIYPFFTGICDMVLSEDSVDKAAEECNVLFLALPHGIASSVVNENILSKCFVIDLGADYRLHDADVYETWYKTEHKSKELLKSAVYGLPELHREEIKNTRLVANPGCYTTCSILTLYPLVRKGLIDISSIVIDAKSGTSGAGRGEKTANLFCEVNESIKAYSVAGHRHTPEIEQELSLASGDSIILDFTPHLVPMQRGILATCYAKLKDGVSADDVSRAYHEAYDGEYFIRLASYLPETRFVRNTNRVDIAWKINSRTGRITALGAIDNLVKGAAGQAVQNMNILFGLAETAGLEAAGGV
ncbi:MAG: N-acetyl-gamma-glutamyl-phosphate reductase [Bullifex sp.]